MTVHNPWVVIYHMAWYSIPQNWPQQNHWIRLNWKQYMLNSMKLAFPQMGITVLIHWLFFHMMGSSKRMGYIWQILYFGWFNHVHPYWYWFFRIITRWFVHNEFEQHHQHNPCIPIWFHEIWVWCHQLYEQIGGWTHFEVNEGRWWIF